MKMINEKIDLIISFVSEEISKKEFEDNFPEVLDENFLKKEYEKAIIEKNSDAIECLSMFSRIYIPDDYLYEVYKKLITECWHSEHENIALMFQFNFKNPDCIESVIKAMQLRCEHWDEEDDRDPFIRKCAYVLATLKTDYAIEKLKELSESEDPIINKYCTYQLEKNNYFKE